MRIIIAAVSEDGFIGKDGKVPWRLKSDIMHFKRTTMGHVVVIGRKTWDSIPERFRPLPSRRNIVVTRQAGFVAKGAEVVNSILDAFAIAEPDEYEKGKHVFVMGGGEIYQLTLPYAERTILTRVNKRVGDGDTRLPEFDPAEWNLVRLEAPSPTNEDECGFVFEYYSPNLRYIELSNVRTAEQLRVMRQIRTAGHCPFCPENLDLYHKEPILWESDHWVLTENQWPYPGKDVHLLLILKRHTESAGMLTVSEWQEYHRVVTRLEENNTFLGGGICMRSGDPILSGATVKHLHAQIISPKRGELVKFHIGTSIGTAGRKAAP